jgi:CubicO group peptidase (beta-lactamase class C family)
MLNRRQILGGLAMSASLASAAKAAFDWPVATPEAAGFAPDLAARIDALVKSNATNIHSTLVLRDGRIVAERYFAGTDFSMITALGEVSFGPETLHDLRSVTKSIVALLYGIALAQGKVAAPDAPLLAQFPEYPDLAADPARQKLLVRHVLTMTLGLEWNESVPYTSTANSEVAMEFAPDRHRFALDRPVVGEPGLRYVYNGGATALIGRLIAKGTGRDLAEFARESLFDPLGIGRTEWHRGRDGVPMAASGLRMTPRDLARIGQMVLAGGRWESRQMVPAAWLADMHEAQAVIEAGRDYGYQWYLGEAAGRRLVTAAGNGGQRLYLLPEPRVAVVVTAGRYNLPDQGAAPLALLRDVILPSLSA